MGSWILFTLIVTETHNYFSQHKERLINVYRFFGRNTCCSSLPDSLWACEINELKFWDNNIINIPRINCFKCNCKNSMRSWRRLIHIMWSNYFVFNSKMKQISDFFSSFTWKDKEVLNHELILSVPPDLQSFRVFLKIWQIQEIIHFFVIDLQKGNMNSHMFSLLWLFMFYLIPYFLDSSLCNSNILWVWVYHRSFCISSVLRFVSFVRVTLHCMSFSRARLSICKNSSVIPFNDSLNHLLDFEAFKNIILSSRGT